MTTTFPIIYLISVPRARSTILFRALEAQFEAQLQTKSDAHFTCYHEPSQAIHDKDKEMVRGATYAVDWFRDTAFRSYDELKQQIFLSSTKGPVLVKEVSFACIKCLDDINFISQPNIFFNFLIRDPLETIASFYKQVGSNIAEFFKDDIGYKQLYNLYKRIEHTCPNKPQIITNEEFRDPYTVISKVLNNSELYYPIQLHWNNLNTNFDGSSWHEQKKPELTRYWHGPAINSTCIMYQESNIKSLDDLLAVVDPLHREQVTDAYYYNLPFYQEFIKN